MNEGDIQRKLMIEASKLGARVFRQNVGLGWTGKPLTRRSGMVQVAKQDLVLRNARPFHAGLCKGSSDLIGWYPLTITEQHVGSTVAVFSAIEVKTKAGRLTKEQRNFLEVVNSSGGFGILAREEGDLKFGQLKL